MSTEIFEAKSRAKLVELDLQSRASVVGKSKVSAARKLSIMLNYVLDLSDYTGMSNVSSNACIS